MAQASQTSWKANTSQNLQQPVPLEIMRIRPHATMPEKAHEDDAGFDLFAWALECLEPQKEEECLSLEELEDLKWESSHHVYAPGEKNVVPTGYAVNIPSGYVGLVVPRSGRSLKEPFYIPNSPGTIDAGYQGELLVPHHCIHEGVKAIPHGEKIAQLIILPLPKFEAKEVKSFNETTSRGTAGFGSTDTKGE